MKALVLALLLISLVGTFALRRTTRHRHHHRDVGHKIADAIAVLDDLQELSESESLNQEFWEGFFEKYDLDGNGLDKDEFHKGIDDWTKRNGFGHQSKPGTDAIFDQLNKDGDEYLSIEEAKDGSQAIFEWYKLITQNVLRKYSNQLSGDLDDTRCSDTKNSVAGFDAFPGVSAEIGASWDENGDGYLSQEEVEENNEVLMDMLFLEHLEDDDATDVFKSLDTDGDGYLNLDQAGDYIRAYLDRIVQNACSA